MASSVSAIFAAAAARLKDQFGERDARGDLAANAITLVIAGREYHLPAVIGDVRYQVEYDPSRQSEVKSELRDVRVTPADLADQEITRLPIRCVVRIDDDEWPVDLANTEWGKLMVKIGLRRDALSRMSTGEKQSGTV